MTNTVPLYNIDAPPVSKRGAALLCLHYIEMAAVYWEVMDEELLEAMLLSIKNEAAREAAKLFFAELKRIYGEYP